MKKKDFEFGSSASHHSSMNGKQTFPGPILAGDPSEDDDDELDGDFIEVEGDLDDDEDDLDGDAFSMGDFSDESFGAIGSNLRKRAAKNKAKKASRKAKRRAKKNSTPVTPASKVASSAAASAATSVPGAALAMNAIVPVMCTNGTIITRGTPLALKGYALKAVLDRFAQLCAHNTIQIDAVCATGATTAQLAMTSTLLSSLFGTADQVVDLLMPVAFVNISGAPNYSAPGVPITIGLTSYDELGRSNTRELWRFERNSIDVPTKMALWPYKSVASRIVPALIRLKATCDKAAWTINYNATIDVLGLSPGQMVSAKFPGLDSEELREFLKPFGMKLS